MTTNNLSNAKETKKVVLGQFFTKDNVWLRPQIVEFIKNTKAYVAYDPFAGAGHLLNAAKNKLSFEKTVGLDIDETLHWNVNDSLISIPHIDNSIIITNPPYISNYSASRKKVGENLKKYFDSSVYDDVYFIALDKMLDAQEYVVAIVPETFINSSYRRKNLLHSITILEESPFDDTDAPVVVLCFDSVVKNFDEIKIYKNDTFIDLLGNIESLRLIPNNSVKMTFNDRQGWLGVRCVDSTDPTDMLRFDFKNNIDYDWDNGIKVSSRLLTLISIDVPESKKQDFINCCNKILVDTRIKTADIIFSPFKGNMKNGVRRRRLDFKTCRAIIESAYQQINNSEIEEKKNEQLSLF
ncbi:MAG: hypothetical protein E7676_01265 [Ruminococcaceae bacterium]|nr:hypothetical protein [Oscillospiraceae bacterium]